eukprot:gene12640-6544_t
MQGDSEDIIEYVRTFNIDKYDVYIEIVAHRNDEELLNTMISLGSDINVYDASVLRMFANKGDLDMVKTLIEEYGANYEHLRGTRALTNYKYIHEYINNLPPYVENKGILFCDAHTESSSQYSEDEDDGLFDRILQEDYEENKEFYEELSKKYPVE